VNRKLEKIWKKAVVAYFETPISKNLLWESEEIA